MSVSLKLNKDLKEERDKVSFNVEELTNWYYGGAEEVREKRFLGKNIILFFLERLDLLNLSKQKIISYRILSYNLTSTQLT